MEDSGDQDTSPILTIINNFRGFKEGSTFSQTPQVTDHPYPPRPYDNGDKIGPPASRMVWRESPIVTRFLLSLFLKPKTKTG